LLINCDPITDADLIKGQQAICASVNDSNIIISLAEVSGVSRDIEYQWMMNYSYCVLLEDKIEFKWEDIMDATDIFFWQRKSK